MNRMRDSLVGRSWVATLLLLCGMLSLAAAKSVPEADFGDAPEGALAYPASGVIGQFPTCVGVGPASWIEHSSMNVYLGPKVDVETNGNADLCPAFNPDSYNHDEGISDGDAGLLKPRAYTIKGSLGYEAVYPLVHLGLEYLGNANGHSSWGINLDIEVHNQRTDGRQAYLNILFDWNQDGKWQGSVLGEDGLLPEHALVNFPIPYGYNGPLSALDPPRIELGPNAGYVWARFTISDRPVGDNWKGDGIFTDGETEDYLLRIAEPLFFCEWNPGDPSKMHWPQTGDLRATGLAVNMRGRPLAEDFQCTETGPITDIHFWGAFKDDKLPTSGVDSMKFKVSILANVPADDKVEWNRPGEVLWSKVLLPYSYDFHQVTGIYNQGWLDPATKNYDPANHRKSFQYNICLRDNEKELFTQYRGNIYWIEIQEVLEEGQEEPPYVFGWKPTERRLQWNARGVWKHPDFGWLPMSYPDGHEYKGLPLDLSLVITGRTTPDMDFGDAPDPTYPTLLISDGARHTIVPGIFLGYDIDAESDGQPDASALGDDNTGIDDEDGVKFVTALIPGDATVVEVTASVPGALNAWCDFNADGDWDDAGEQIFKDESLAPGVNTLAFFVPAKAEIGSTFSRWRFSTLRGLKPTGEAPDGEVEDYLVKIETGGAPGPQPSQHVKWSQPPIERVPGSDVALFCGWDEPSYTSKPLQTTFSSWAMAADDFRCSGEMPVTSVRWWGSYRNWEGDEAPSLRPQSWRIAFWSNIPADDKTPYSRPGDLLWVVGAEAKRVSEKPAGSDAFPGQPVDTCFEYVLKLDPDEFFYGSDYSLGMDDDAIFWISITAVYTGSPNPGYVWGWKTRPEPWMDGAVTFELRRDDLRVGITPDPATVAPVTNSLVCERLDMFDMAFELDTDPNYVKWAQAFTGLRNWPHYEDEVSLVTTNDTVEPEKWRQDPDLNRTGMDVDVTKDLPPTWPAQIGADDFECTTTGPITGITLWGSWYHDVLPSGNPENVKFILSIRADIPASLSHTGYSMPGDVLWRKEFPAGTFDAFLIETFAAQYQGYYSPANDVFESENHFTTYRYVFDIDPKEAFDQVGTEKNPKVYWLAVQAYVINSPGSVATRFGWKNAAQHRNDAAVWANGTEPYAGSWQKLTYPKGHSLSPQPVDLAFAIQTQGTGGASSAQRLVADNWECTTLTPVTGLVWWGSYVGYGYQPCECQQAEPPQRPDAFLVSIWSDDLVTSAFGRPDQKLWEYRVEDFDEVLVGFDKHPESSDSDVKGFEPVYRYTVRLPEKDWFSQTDPTGVYWLSIAAVYDGEKTMTYPWGWTNHPSEPWDASDGKGIGRNSDAVAGTLKGNGDWDWVELYDQTGASEDMSFVLFTDPDAGLGDKDGLYIEGPWPTKEVKATDASKK